MARATAPRQKKRHKTVTTTRMSPELTRFSMFPRFFAVGGVLRFGASHFLANFFTEPVLR
jgi:hypothetical protein